MICPVCSSRLKSLYNTKKTCAHSILNMLQCSINGISLDYSHLSRLDWCFQISWSNKKRRRLWSSSSSSYLIISLINQRCVNAQSNSISDLLFEHKFWQCNCEIGTWFLFKKKKKLNEARDLNLFEPRPKQFSTIYTWNMILLDKKRNRKEEEKIICC